MAIMATLIMNVKRAKLTKKETTMSDQNIIIIDQARIEAGGKLAAQQNSLNDLKAIISSLIDSVRGDEVLVISCEVKTAKKAPMKKKEKKNDPKPKSASGKKPAKSKNNPKSDDSAVSTKAGSKDTGAPKSDTSSEGSDSGSGSEADKAVAQENDPLAGNVG